MIMKESYTLLFLDFLLSFFSHILESLKNDTAYLLLRYPIHHLIMMVE